MKDRVHIESIMRYSKLMQGYYGTDELFEEIFCSTIFKFAKLPNKIAKRIT